MNNKKTSLLILATVMLLPSCGVVATQNTPISQTVENQTTEASKSQSFSYEDYAEVLSTYVNENGEVDYAQLKENRAALDRFNQSLGQVTRATYESWTESEQIAFWVNAYNSFTLQAIIDKYPVKSIKNIPGVWKFLKFEILGESMTLDGIEHKVLRKEFNEPRIHMALVCAAVSCPYLRQEPYEGDKLEAQLEENTIQFLSLDSNFSLDAEAETVKLSAIFKWFKEDWEATYGTEEKFTKFNSKEGSVLNFITNYVEGEDLTKLEGAQKISYIDYDWSLNKQ